MVAPPADCLLPWVNNSNARRQASRTYPVRVRADRFTTVWDAADGVGEEGLARDVSPLRFQGLYTPTSVLFYGPAIKGQCPY
jgi:hypothetical protein